MTARLQEAAGLYRAGDYPAAELVCRVIIEQDPGHFDALHLLGVLLTKLDRAGEALAYLRRAELERPDHGLLRVNLGNALLATQQYEQAALVSQAGGADALNNLGLARRGQGLHDEAAEAFRRATQARWDHTPAWFNLATTLAKLGQLEEALGAATTALRVAPLDTPVHRLADITNEVGRILMDLGRPEEALAMCRGFLERHPGQQTVTWNMSLCLLQLGRFEEGWRAYECRFDVPGHDRRPDGAVVLDPRLVAGKRVLILAEQGRGDMLQFIRYAPLLTDLGATVLVQAYPDLVRLLAAMPGIGMVVGVGDPRPAADLVTSVMSLPLAFGIERPNVPYLRVPAGLRAAGAGGGGRVRIGIAWSGSAESRERSAVPAAALAPLLALPGFEFHCVQTDITASDQAWLDMVKPPVEMHGRHLVDFADTAGLVAEMDAVVSVDTAIVHLAGGLGKPVYVLLAFNPDWRWMLGRDDSPWYPTARLFRQPARGAWTPVVEAVIAALATDRAERTVSAA